MKTVFESDFDMNTKYIISLQGVTTSGKTTLSSCLLKLLEDNENLKPVRISTDHFYKNDPFKGKTDYEIERYNPDNPKSIDWEAMKECIRDVIEEKDKYRLSSYDFDTKRRSEVKIKNPGFNIIILEGIFAHNLVNDEIFNLDELDHFNSDKKIENLFVKNDFISRYKNNVKIVKIFMNLNKEAMLETRKKVDFIRSGWDEEYSRDFFENKVYPSTVKWVLPNKNSKIDIIIDEGTRDIEKCVDFLKSITDFFGKNYEKKYLRDLLMKEIHDEAFKN